MKGTTLWPTMRITTDAMYDHLPLDLYCYIRGAWDIWADPGSGIGDGRWRGQSYD